MGSLPSFAAARAEMERRFGILANHVPELIDMRFGRRRAIQLSLSADEFERRRRALGDFAERAGFSLRTRISRGAVKALLLRRGDEAAVDTEDEQEMGRRFGYPACCRRRFSAQSKARLFDPFINEQDRRLAGVGRLPFELNPYLRSSPFHLYKHFPCRPDCPASVREARRLLLLVRSHQPELARDIERFGRWPALTTGICGQGFIFDGEFAGPRLRYREVAASGEPATLLPLSRRNRPADAVLFSRLARLLAESDEAELDRDGLAAWRGGRATGRIDRPAHLRWRWLRFVSR